MASTSKQVGVGAAKYGLTRGCLCMCVTVHSTDWTGWRRAIETQMEHVLALVFVLVRDKRA